MQGQNPHYDYRAKLLLIGNAKTGKSTIIRRLCEGVFLKEYAPTRPIGIDFKLHSINLKDKVVSLQILDTAGEERSKTIISPYYRYKGAHGIMLVYNIADRHSFEDIEHWLDQLKKYADEKAAKAVKVLIGNKCDLEGQREVSFEEAKAYADDKGMQFFETSAKSGEYLEEAFLWIVDKIKTELEREKENEVMLNNKAELEQKSKRSGCY